METDYERLKRNEHSLVNDIASLEEKIHNIEKLLNEQQKKTDSIVASGQAAIETAQSNVAKLEKGELTSFKYCFFQV